MESVEVCDLLERNVGDDITREQHKIACQLGADVAEGFGGTRVVGHHKQLYLPSKFRVAQWACRCDYG